jgi:hypothetical protein
VKLAAGVLTTILYLEAAILGNENSPVREVVEVNTVALDISVSTMVEPETGLPPASRSTPVQEAVANAATLNIKTGKAARYENRR